MSELKKLQKLHKPVLLNEVVEVFGLNALLKGKVNFIDATVGLGGHTEAIVKSGANVLGIDSDVYTLKLAKKRLEKACPIPEKNTDFQGSFKLIHGNFRNIDDIARKESFEQVDGILFDLGVSSLQLLSRKRGFSFQEDNSLLDMRLDPTNQQVKASDLLNGLRKDQLLSLFQSVMKYKDAFLLSLETVRTRSVKNINTVADFKDIIKRTVRKKGKKNVSTLPFLALRIAVNSELENLAEALPKAFSLLKNGGKLAVITFHSGEDLVVKRLFGDLETQKKGSIQTEKPIVPSPEEVRENARARSAKMRVIRKI